MKYCYPEFVRSSGLGNKLFPWARCAIFGRDRDIPMLAPRWISLRRGPLLRDGSLHGGVSAEAFAGKIFLANNFRSSSLASALHREFVLRRYVIVDESKRGESVEDATAPGNTVVRFRGDGNHFADLLGEANFLRERINEIASENALRRARAAPASPLVLNVRIAKDFRAATADDDYVKKGAVRTPLSWFVMALRRIRAHCKVDVPALIVSDGSNAELAELLVESAVETLQSRTAIEDLLALSSARVIVGSGGSSFTAWGAFLAQAHVITIAGQSLNWFRLEKASDGQVVSWALNETEFDGLDAICAALTQSP